MIEVFVDVEVVNHRIYALVNNQFKVNARGLNELEGKIAAKMELKRHQIEFIYFGLEDDL